MTGFYKQPECYSMETYHVSTVLFMSISKVCVNYFFAKRNPE